MGTVEQTKDEAQAAATSVESLAATPAERLAQSIRDLIQEELQEEIRPASKPQPSWKDAIWVGVVVADAILIITQVPEQIFKNTSFEFASNLVGYVFGGVLLVYASWAREQLMKLVQIGWCRATLLTLLVTLLFARAHIFPVRPRIQPVGASLLVDGDPVRVRFGTALSLSFGSHDVKVLAPENSQNGAVAPKPYEFTISPIDLITSRFQVKNADLWTPLYPLSIPRNFEKSILKLRRNGGFFDGIRESQQLDVALDGDGTMEILDKAELPMVFVPLGQYCILESEKAGVGYKEFGYEVVDGINAPTEKDEVKPCAAK